MKLNKKAQQVIEYLLVVVVVVAGVLMIARPFANITEKALNGAIATIYQGYTWRLGDPSQCNAVCGAGTAWRSVWCESNDTRQIVADSYCASKGPRPSETVDCNGGTCGAWEVSGFGLCSKACGGGTKTRSVVCKNSTGIVVTDGNCPPPKPPSEEPCNTSPCFSWTESKTCMFSSPCNPTCGMGHCQQTVTCIDNLTGLPTADGKCSADPKPSTTISCSGPACGYDWSESGWGTCDQPCGPGEQKQVVQCVRSDGHIETDESPCLAKRPRPDTTRMCNLGTCYHWNRSSWGTCTTICGPGTQTAVVQCLNSSGVVVADTNCVLAEKPADTQPCPSNPPCGYSWGNGDWGTCSTNCAGGTQTRPVFCTRTNDGQVMPDLTECRKVDPAGERPASQDCTGPCYKWVTPDWSTIPCPNTCGNGTKTRTYECRDNNGTGAIVANTNCLTAVGAPPTTTQPCTGTTTCCGNRICDNLPSAGYTESCSTCPGDCNVCGDWTSTGLCGASGGCPDWHVKSTKSCTCSGVQSSCTITPTCVFLCNGSLSPNSTQCLDAQVGLTANLNWSYGACDGTKCRATCNSGYIVTAGGCSAAFHCNGFPSANSTACPNATVGLTSTLDWSYVSGPGGCNGIKCQAYCAVGYRATAGGCISKCGDRVCDAGENVPSSPCCGDCDCSGDKVFYTNQAPLEYPGYYLSTYDEFRFGPQHLCNYIAKREGRPGKYTTPVSPVIGITYACHVGQTSQDFDNYCIEDMKCSHGGWMTCRGGGEGWCTGYCEGVEWVKCSYTGNCCG